MADEVPAGFSLKRWSRRKLDATRSAREASAPPVVGAAADPTPAQPPMDLAATSPSALPAASAEPELPPVASLSFESDFSAFMQPKVDEGLKREALKKLFSDPRFNVMDGLDTYIDDYSRPDPISAELVREMTQSRYIFDPPQTRINAEGFAEDVPADEKVARVDESGADDATGVASVVPAPPSSDAAAPPAIEGPAVAQAIPEQATGNEGADLPDSNAEGHPASPAQSPSR